MKKNIWDNLNRPRQSMAAGLFHEKA